MHMFPEFSFNILYSKQETVEEGKPVTLTCVDSVSKQKRDTLFNWYKARLANQSLVNIIAFYDNSEEVQFSYGDFQNRATIDGTTGALTILKTEVSDDHFYSCWFISTATRDIKNETELTITVNPSQRDLKITTSPPVKVGATMSFKCKASRVRPPPRHMYWQFTDDASQIFGTYRINTNVDNLTSSVSVEYTMVVKRNDSRRKLICHFVTAAGNIIQSEEATVKVIYSPSGQPKITQGDKISVKVNSTVSLTCETNAIDGAITWYKWQFLNGTELGKTIEKTWTYTIRGNETRQFVCIAGNAAGQTKASPPIDIEIRKDGQPVNFFYVVLGTLLLTLIAAIISVVAAYCCTRWISTDGRVLFLNNTVQLQKDDDRHQRKGLNPKQNLKGARCVTRDQGSSIVDEPTYEEVDDRHRRKGVDCNPKRNLKRDEIPTYLELH